MKLCWKYTYPCTIQDVDEFVSSSDLEKCSITSLAHQWILCSEWVPSEWESKQLIITVIHTTLVWLLTSCEAVFVRNKATENFNFNHHFWPKYKFLIHNNAFSGVSSSPLVWIRRETCTDQVLFTSENVQTNMLEYSDERTTGDLSLDEAY